MVKLKRILVVASACFLVLVTWWFLRGVPDARVVRLEKLTAELADAAPGSTDQGISWRQWWRELDALPPPQQASFWSARRRELRESLRSFVKASPLEQRAIVLDTICSIKAFRSRWQTADTSAVAGASVPGPGWRTSLNPLELEQRQQQWLSMTTAQERAQVEIFLRMLAAANQSLGTSSTSPWGDDCPT